MDMIQIFILRCLVEHYNDTRQICSKLPFKTQLLYHFWITYGDVFRYIRLVIITVVFVYGIFIIIHEIVWFPLLGDETSATCIFVTGSLWKCLQVVRPEFQGSQIEEFSGPKERPSCAPGSKGQSFWWIWKVWVQSTECVGVRTTSLKLLKTSLEVYGSAKNKHQSTNNKPEGGNENPESTSNQPGILFATSPNL